MSLVKVESNTGLCHGCLSAGRRTAPPGDYSGLFFGLIGPQQPYNVYNNEEAKLCWECMGTLRRLHAFQAQLRSAQHMLMQMLYHMTSDIHSLSKLKTSNKNGYDCEFNNIHTKTEKETKKIDLEIITEITTATVKEENDTFDDIYNDEFECDNYGKTDEDTKDNIMNVIKKEKKTKKKKTIKKITTSLEEKRILRRKINSLRLSTKYKKYARLVSNETKDWGVSYEKYFTRVYLSETEMERILERDSVKRSYEKSPYKCKECKRGYVRSTDLSRHRDLNHHMPNTPYQCHYCRQEQPSLETLREHWRQHTPMYKCNMCGELVRPMMQKRHLNNEHTKLYNCRDCKREFGSLSKFALHYKDAHDTFTCHDCGKVCHERRVLIKHIAHKHGDYRCETCVREYPTYHKFREHNKMYHPERLNKQVNLRELAYCVECDRQYPSVLKYKKHLKESSKHTPKAPVLVPCPECGKMFARKVYMNNHYRLTHLKVTKHYCQMCNKYYANSYGLKIHNESVHLKLPKLKDKICDICGRGFHSNGVLIKHRRTHTGERPYKCSYCTASFAQITAMKTHQRTQHKEHVPRPSHTT